MNADRADPGHPHPSSTHSGRIGTGSTRWRQWAQTGRRWSGRHRLSTAATAVVAATLMFAGVCLAFLMNTPVLQGPDEVFHYDRIMAAEHGKLAPDPGSFHISTASRKAEAELVPHVQVPVLRRFAISSAPLRSNRLSYDQDGGDARSPTLDVPNYITQHPPLYYDLMGGLTWLIPGSDSMPQDRLMLILEFIDILIVLPLPYLMYRSARTLLGENALAAAAAFLPLLVPGLPRSAATMNNDNLAILIGAALIAFSLEVALGDLRKRTAVAVSALCVAGSLTKATVLFVLVIVPAAYLIGAVRTRRLPAVPVLGVLAAGAVATAAWWVRNVLRFGRFQPDGFGNSGGAALGAPRPPGQPASLQIYLNTVRDSMPSRFWGALGLLEPPALPEVMIWGLTAAAVLAAVLAVAVLRRRRWAVLIAVGTPTAALAMVCYQAFRHWQHYLSIPGLQGRYAYPSIFGVLFPLSILGAVLLGRLWRWTSVLVASIGVLVTGWAVYTSAGYFWLPAGRPLRPSAWGAAIRQLFSWSALPPALTAAVLAVAALALLSGFALAIAAVVRDGDRRRLRDVLAPAADHGVTVRPGVRADVPVSA